MYSTICFVLLSAIVSVSAMPTNMDNIGRRETGVERFRSGLKWSNRAWGEGRKHDHVHHDTDVVDVDLFDAHENEIRDYQKDGKKVICYVNVGASESWREDYKDNKHDFKKAFGKKVDGWKREYWFDIVHKLPEVKAIMSKRFELAKKKGCDGIEADNVDCYANDCVHHSSKHKKKEAQLDYDKWQAKKAHSLGMAIGLKNSLDLIDELVDHYDFAVNEQCVEYGECKHLKPFKEQNKAIFGTEYDQSSHKIKKEAKKYGIMEKNEKHGKWKNMW